MTGDGSQGWRDMYAVRVEEAEQVAFVALGQIVAAGSALWQIASAERVFNGKGDEVHVVVARGDDLRRHVVA